MVAYNERILATSVSPQRRYRAERMLVNVRPHLERLERDEAGRIARIERATPPASTVEGQLQRLRDRARDVDFEVVWDGTRGREGASLTSDLFRSGLRGQ